MTTSDALRAVERISELYREGPDVVDLARVASLAVRVESHLLRRLRIELLSHIDVGIEADLWFSDLVETRGVRHIVLDAAMAEVLRGDLRDHRELLDAAYAVTESAHANEPPSIVLEERLNYLSLKDPPDRAARINEALHPALRTLARGGEPARDLAQWALRALPRLVPAALECENGIALTLAASAVLGQRRVVGQVPEIDLPMDRFAWALPRGSEVDTTTIAVELIDHGIRFAESGPESRTLKLPATTPLLLELSWNDGGTGMSTIVQAEPGRAIDLETVVDRVTLRTLAGDVYEVREGVAEGVAEVGAEGTTAWAEPSGQRVAVLVGVGAYASFRSVAPRTGVPELAAELADLGYETHVLEVGSDFGEPTPDALFRALEDLGTRSGPDGLTWLHFSGAGQAGPEGLEAIGLLDEKRNARWVSYRDVEGTLRKLTKGQVLVTIEISRSVEAGEHYLDVGKTPGPQGKDITTMFAETHGGAWEEYGPVAFSLLQTLREVRQAEEPLYDVFVSYAQEDARWARSLEEGLRAHGLRVFLDKESIPPGELIGEAIETAVGRSRSMVVLLSPSSVPSSFVEEEWRSALQAGVRLIPVVLGDLRPDQVPMELQKIHWLRVGDQGPSGVAAEVARAVQELPARSQPSMTLGAVLERVREAYTQWAHNNDFEPRFSLHAAGDLDFPMAGASAREPAEVQSEAPAGSASTADTPDLPPPPVEWDETSMERARSVALISDPDGRPVGAGFLLRGGALSKWLDPDEPLLLTCAHVVTPDPSPSTSGLAPNEAVITFEDTEATHRVAGVVWHSPPERLDAVLLRLEPSPSHAQGLPVARKPPFPGGGRRVNLVGPPGSRALSAGVQDNALVGYDPPRVHYRAPTEPGSAGSPVFNEEWEVIALHHAASDRMPRLYGEEGTYPMKEGISIESIREVLDRELSSPAQARSSRGEESPRASANDVEELDHEEGGVLEAATTLNIRSGPGTDQPKVGDPLPPGAHVRVLEEDEQWRLVEVISAEAPAAGLRGWVHGSYLRPVSEPPSVA